MTISAGVGGVSQVVRYLVYRAFRGVGTANQQSQILIQTIDDSNGRPIGQPRALTPFSKAANGGIEAAQSIAIAPDASHIIFSAFSNSCTRYIVKGLMLSPTGTPVGGSKTISACSKITESGARGFNFFEGSQSTTP